MHIELAKWFSKYPPKEAPFMHQQLKEWSTSRPLAGLRIIHHVPVVANTLLKIACLIKAGADVTITNPTSFCHAHPEAVSCLKAAGLTYIEQPESLIGEQFDLYFDCGAQLYQFLGKPTIGAIELTGSGDHYYRQQNLDFPVFSIDRTMTKQLETVFGCAQSSHTALKQLTSINPAESSWIVFGFGKIGRGLAYFCVQNKIPIVVVDLSVTQRAAAQTLGIHAIDPLNRDQLEQALSKANVVVTATGKKAVMDEYPYSWFKGKILANMGVYDEFGSQFAHEEVLNNKMPVNFVLNDPTPMMYIDPEFYLHNLAALELLKGKQSYGVHDIGIELDHSIIHQWCKYHQFSLEIINSWFISM